VTDGPVVQVFGRDDSQATRRCLRFFKERRMPISFVDVTRRPPAPAELRRFNQRYGARALLDEEGRAYRDAGLAWMRLSDAEILERLREDPGLLRLPLARFGADVTIGVDEATWKEWQRRR
jgi:arsenate reductase-like glutaredoxin family protein